MILGLELPTAGEISFRGKTVSHRVGRQRAARVHGQCAAGVPEPVRGVQPAEADRPLSGVDRQAVPQAEQAATTSTAAMDGALQKVGLSLAEVKGRYPARDVAAGNCSASPSRGR